ncbi:hypothetical protein [Halorussus salinisoli]|uniref:hypothetical protein n=1 Tax=Halorussus salinisoli TaxID=2558242 RepID=UPI0010C18BC0|nr:hypothetical protein [Halorussus salinisoli]
MATESEDAEEVTELSTRDRFLRGAYAGLTFIAAGCAVSVVAQNPTEAWAVLIGGAILLVAASEYHNLLEHTGVAA